jgi:hypothetical protein
MTNPADELRTAAQTLRKLTFQADGGPWETTWRGQQYHLDGYRNGDLHPISEWTYAIATWEPEASQQRAECDTANADYIAAMHPGVGAALADWLKESAVVHLPDTECGYCDPRRNPKRLPCPALAVARQINAASA